MKKLLVLALVCGTSYANFPSEEGKITYFQVHNNINDKSDSGQRYIIRLDSEISENTCGNDQWTGLLDSEGGKAIYSAILTAAVSGKSVILNGNGKNSCLNGSMIIRNVFLVY